MGVYQMEVETSALVCMGVYGFFLFLLYYFLFGFWNSFFFLCVEEGDQSVRSSSTTIISPASTILILHV